MTNEAGNRTVCAKCGAALLIAVRGRPRKFCSAGCKAAARLEVRRIDRRIDRLEDEVESLRRDQTGLLRADTLMTATELRDHLCGEIAKLEQRMRELLAD